MITTEFNANTGILHAKFIEVVTVDQLIHYIQTTKENKSYPRVLKILTDASVANFVLTTSDLHKIVEENYKSIEKYDLIMDAIISITPKQTATTLLYREFAKTNKYKFEVFSTLEAAKNWLLKY